MSRAMSRFSDVGCYDLSVTKAQGVQERYLTMIGFWLSYRNVFELMGSVGGWVCWMFGVGRFYTISILLDHEDQARQQES